MRSVGDDVLVEVDDFVGLEIDDDLADELCVATISIVPSSWIQRSGIPVILPSNVIVSVPSSLNVSVPFPLKFWRHQWSASFHGRGWRARRCRAR